MDGHGDLNNAHAGRTATTLAVDPAYSHRSLAILADQDEVDVRANYRPFLTDGNLDTGDWVSQLELSTVTKMVQSQILDQGADRLRVLVLYGSLRSR